VSTPLTMLMEHYHIVIAALLIDEGL
jgi:hypothetical protein